MSAVITIPPAPGITNAAPVNVIPVSDGTNLAGSGSTDDGAVITVGPNGVVVDRNTGSGRLGGGAYYFFGQGGTDPLQFGDVGNADRGQMIQIDSDGIKILVDPIHINLSINTLPTTDPGISGALWRDPILNSLFVSP